MSQKCLRRKEDASLRGNIDITSLFQKQASESYGNINWSNCWDLVGIGNICRSYCFPEFLIQKFVTWFMLSRTPVVELLQELASNFELFQSVPISVISNLFQKCKNSGLDEKG